MSDEDLELLFLNLQHEFAAFHSKIDGLIDKYEVIEKKLERQIKGSFKCRKCKQTFETMKKLKKHKNADECCADDFKCENCDKTFNSEHDLRLHQKTHGEFKCKKCDCKYDIMDLLEKHTSAVHGQMKIFCHYFNNDKECPFKDQCIFAHEDSRDCKFGQQCERMLCMFVHESRDMSDSEEESDSDEDENENDDDNDTVIKIQDIEPCLLKVEEAMKKVQVLLLPTSQLKCNICEFEAKNMNGLKMHKKAKHPDNSA